MDPGLCHATASDPAFLPNAAMMHVSATEGSEMAMPSCPMIG
jgi:hypothetical protein